MSELYALAMFPLGMVLFPHAPTALHVFEPRYRALMHDCLAATGEFGIVLIERGHEVGGGDARFEIGTVARITEAVQYPDGRWGLTALGVRRIRVEHWLPDNPYPYAEVRDLEATPLADAGLLAQCERAVRRAVAFKAELNEAAVPTTFVLDDDIDVAGYELAAIAPIGPFDKQSLLVEGDGRTRVERLLALVEEENAVLAQRLAGG